MAGAAGRVPAGPDERFLAHAIDTVAACFCMFVALMPATAIGLFLGGVAGGLAPVVTILLIAAVHPAYFILLGRRGVTPGKRHLGIAVVRESGEPMDAHVAVARYAAGVLSALTLGIGHLILVFDPERRALQDRLAGTRVVRVAPVPAGRKMVAGLLLGVFLAAGTWGVLRARDIMFRKDGAPAVASSPAP